MLKLSLKFFVYLLVLGALLVTVADWAFGKPFLNWTTDADMLLWLVLVSMMTAVALALSESKKQAGN